MNVAIVGSGSVGQALAGGLSKLGHQIFMGTRNVKESLSNTGKDSWGNTAVGAWIKDYPLVKLVSFKESVEKGNDLIVFAINGQAALSCLKEIGEPLLNDKIMLDISNPLDFSNGFPPSLFVCNTESLGEQIQRAYPRLKVVKTLNTINASVMVNPKGVPGDHTVFMSGNDNNAKIKAKAILNGFGWDDTNIIDLGDITSARGTEMILPLWIRLFGKLQTPMFNFNINIAKQQFG